MTGRRSVVPPLVAAVRREVAAVERRRRGAARGSVEAELAVELAGRVCDVGEPLAARVSAAKALVEVVAALRGLAPEAGSGDRLDELGARREARRARA